MGLRRGLRWRRVLKACFWQRVLKGGGLRCILATCRDEGVNKSSPEESGGRQRKQ